MMRVPRSFSETEKSKLELGTGCLAPAELLQPAPATRGTALSEGACLRRGWALASVRTCPNPPLPLFQNEPRGHPPGGDALRPVPTVASERRGSPTRARCRCESGNGQILVAQFGPIFAAEIRRRRVEGTRSSHWRWQLDEMFVKIKGERHDLWRAVDHEGEVLESFVTKTRDKKAALKFLKKALRKHGEPEVIVTDMLRSYGAALQDIGAGERQETGRWLNNRAENSHLAFRRRERAMLRFRRMRSLQKFASVHASVSNHFNQERSLSSRHLFKLNRTAALTEWRGLCAE